MLFRLSVLLVALVVGHAAHAQKPVKWGFALQHHLAAVAPDTEVDVFIGGRVGAITAVVKDAGGRVKRSTEGWVSATLPASGFTHLAAAKAVELVLFSNEPGRVLNDSMRVKTRVPAAAAGEVPLHHGYTGSGTIVGIIDTGIDPAHPDFQHPDGRTRILAFWDQSLAFNAARTPRPFGYGQACDSAVINAGGMAVIDRQSGHGTTVAGAAAGNGSATGRYAGVAPDADLVIVSSNLSRSNWSASVVDAVDFILNVAEAYDMPASINLSLGTYRGSHDGFDPASLMLRDILTEAPGRSLTCAAGNSGAFEPYHLRTDVSADSSFTWLRFRNNVISGTHGLAFVLWADTADMRNVQFGLGADRRTGGYRYRAQQPLRGIHANLDVVRVDTLRSFSGHMLGRVQSYAYRRGGQFSLEVIVDRMDSADHYNYRFTSQGQGRFDIWGSTAVGLSQMQYVVPTVEEYPPMAKYVRPDSLQSIVDAWACMPEVITVGNYVNMHRYLDMNGNEQVLGGTAGAIAANSSRGPARTGQHKPDVSAPGDLMLSAAPIALLEHLRVNEPNKLAPGGMHMRNGGTSMAAPAVTGVVALLMEQCPRLTAARILEALRASAYSDAYTGELPGLRFGYGKVDAFAALVHLLPTAAITGPDAVCPGDSVELASADQLTAWQWSTGDTSQWIWTGPGERVLNGSDLFGCPALADTLVVEERLAPEVVVEVDGLVLSTSTLGELQWFVDGEAILGATTAEWVALVNGTYTLRVTDEEGCVGWSEPLVVSTVGMAQHPVEALVAVPNPASDRLRLLGADAMMGWRLLDVLGREVAPYRSFSTNERALSMEQLPAGLYHLELYGAAGKQVLRVVKR